jgi:hypothetical protein
MSTATSVCYVAIRDDAQESNDRRPQKPQVVLGETPYDPGASRLRAVDAAPYSYCAFASSGFALIRAVFKMWTAKLTMAPAAKGIADHK